MKDPKSVQFKSVTVINNERDLIGVGVEGDLVLVERFRSSKPEYTLIKDHAQDIEDIAAAEKAARQAKAEKDDTKPANQGSSEPPKNGSSGGSDGGDDQSGNGDSVGAGGDSGGDDATGSLDDNDLENPDDGDDDSDSGTGGTGNGGESGNTD